MTHADKIKIAAIELAVAAGQETIIVIANASEPSRVEEVVRANIHELVFMADGWQVTIDPRDIVAVITKPAT